MPHSRSGVEIEAGDIVHGHTWDGKPVVGEVLSVVPNSTSCNMTVSYVAMVPQAQYGTFTCGEFELLKKKAEL